MKLSRRTVLKSIAATRRRRHLARRLRARHRPGQARQDRHPGAALGHRRQRRRAAGCAPRNGPSRASMPRRHRRPQDRARRRGGDQRQGHHRSLPEAGAAGKGRLRAGHRLDRRRAGARAGGGGGARAHHLLGRHDPGRRRREAAQSEIPLPQHRQRVRGRDVLAAGHQALEGPVQAHRRHQSRTIPTAATTWRRSWRC